MIDGGSRIASCAQIGRGVKFGAGSGMRHPRTCGSSGLDCRRQHPDQLVCEAGVIGEGAVVASGVVMASGKKIIDEETGEVVPH